MTKIFLLSDTHGYWNTEWIKYFQQADEVWHAGDIGNDNVLNTIQSLCKNKTIRIVYGNIDESDIRTQTNEYLYFELENFKILITHIAGTYGKYSTSTQKLIQNYHPDILVCGHSHILKVKWDNAYNLWYINPGAAGKYGVHKVCTALFFELDSGKILNMKIIEWEK